MADRQWIEVLIRQIVLECDRPGIHDGTGAGNGNVAPPDAYETLQGGLHIRVCCIVRNIYRCLATKVQLKGAIVYGAGKSYRLPLVLSAASVL